MEGDLTWGGEHTIQYTDDVLQNCTAVFKETGNKQVNKENRVYIRCGKCNEGK